jgi:hypothetical protein
MKLRIVAANTLEENVEELVDRAEQASKDLRNLIRKMEPGTPFTKALLDACWQFEGALDKAYVFKRKATLKAHVTTPQMDARSIFKGLTSQFWSEVKKQKSDLEDVDYAMAKLKGRCECYTDPKEVEEELYKLISNKVNSW